MGNVTTSVIDPLIRIVWSSKLPQQRLFFDSAFLTSRMRHPLVSAVDEARQKAVLLGDLQSVLGHLMCLPHKRFGGSAPGV